MWCKVPTILSSETHLMSLSTCHFPLQQAILSDNMNLSNGNRLTETVEGVGGG